MHHSVNRGHAYEGTGGPCAECGMGPGAPQHQSGPGRVGVLRLLVLMTSLAWLVAGLAALGLMDRLRPEPKCQHNNIRGHCTKCNGQTRERIPTGTFRGRSGGRLVPVKKKRKS